jgi:hypothetical protein
VRQAISLHFVREALVDLRVLLLPRRYQSSPEGD